MKITSFYIDGLNFFIYGYEDEEKPREIQVITFSDDKKLSVKEQAWAMEAKIFDIENKNRLYV